MTMEYMYVCSQPNQLCSKCQPSMHASSKKERSPSLRNKDTDGFTDWISPVSVDKQSMDRLSSLYCLL